MSTLVIKSRAESPELKKAACSIEQAAWNDLGYLNYTRAHYELYAEMLEEYPEYQLCLVDQERNYPVATANSVPIAAPATGALPPEGWDWVVEQAERTRRYGGANVLAALAISVPVVHRSKGYARVMIRALLDLADRKGLGGLVAPVRPSAKASHPRVPISDYVRWTDERGRPYDPWLRSHVSCGGRIVGPCERSMVVSEPLGFWENWSKSSFQSSGTYEIEGALVPIEIDVERQLGRYEEPNVWVRYSLGA